jgi:energy-converting hydrogenase A subunit R
MSLDKVVVVGDSITDSKMLGGVNEAGGLAVAFNANEYALPKATVGLASTCLYDLLPVLDAWEKGGREAVKVVVKVKEVIGGVRDRDYFHWVEGVRDLGPILQIHYRIRRLVREGAAKLG